MCISAWILQKSTKLWLRATKPSLTAICDIVGSKLAASHDTVLRCQRVHHKIGSLCNSCNLAQGIILFEPQPHSLSQRRMANSRSGRIQRPLPGASSPTASVTMPAKKPTAVPQRCHSSHPQRRHNTQYLSKVISVFHDVLPSIPRHYADMSLAKDPLWKLHPVHRTSSASADGSD